MAKIIWSKYALEDIESIHDFIARESSFYAQKTIEDFFARVQILPLYPEIGREVPEYSKPYIRELIVGNYRIFYKVLKRSIYIIRVHHSAKNIRRKK